MTKRGIKSRSKMFRIMLRDGEQGAPNPDLEDLAGREPGIDGTILAAAARKIIAGMAGLQVATGDDYPGMGNTGYCLALVVAGQHMDEIMSGTLPMVHDDVLAADLDPYGKKTWELYTVVLPEFFQVVLGLDGPPAMDIRYDPLDSVDGQHAGAIQGEAVSYCEVYPDGDTARYVKIEVRTASQVVPVLVPAGLGGEGVAAGMTVYAAGVFTVARQKVMMRACKCVGVRMDGYDAIYNLADQWGLTDAAAGEIINMLRGNHGDEAAKYAPVFVKYARMDRRVSWEDRVLEMPDGGLVSLDEKHIRSGPGGWRAIRECTKMWPRVFQRAERAGAVGRLLEPGKSPLLKKRTGEFTGPAAAGNGPTKP